VVGFGGVLLLPAAASDAVAPYVDPALVIVAAGLVLPTSYSLLRTTAVELLEMAPAPEIDAPVRAAVTEVMARFGLGNPVIRLSKVGGKLYVEVDHLAEPGTWPVDQVDRLRHALDERLDEFPYDSWLNVDLSTDPSWGLSDAGDGR
jgi:predicted Co/Zn/Cd cation transporter (cation efflux family)